MIKSTSDSFTDDLDFALEATKATAAAKSPGSKVGGMKTSLAQINENDLSVGSKFFKMDRNTFRNKDFRKSINKSLAFEIKSKKMFSMNQKHIERDLGYGVLFSDMLDTHTTKGNVGETPARQRHDSIFTGDKSLVIHSKHHGSPMRKGHKTH